MEGRGEGQGGGIYEGGSDGWTGVWVGGVRGRNNGSCRRRECGRWEMGRHGGPKVSQDVHALQVQARCMLSLAGLGRPGAPGSDRGAARFARNSVVMAAVGPLILSSRRERGCWRSSGWSSGKESASRVPIRHVQPGSASSKRARLALPLAVPWTGGPSLLSRGLGDMRTLVGTPPTWPSPALPCLPACLLKKIATGCWLLEGRHAGCQSQQNVARMLLMVSLLSWTDITNTHTQAY